jgi:hypothetical protein
MMPAHGIRPIAALGHEEGRLGQVVLFGQRLEEAVFRKSLEQHHRGRIAGEAARREGVHLKNPRFHPAS